MRTVTYQVLLQTIPDDGYCAMTLGLPDCVGRGQTRDEAVANLKEAVELYLEEFPLKEVGKPKPIMTTFEVPVHEDEKEIIY